MSLDPLLDDLAGRVARRVLDHLPPAPAPDDEWFDAKGAANYAASPLSAIYEAAENGTLKVARRGRALRFRRTWLDAWLEGR